MQAQQKEGAWTCAAAKGRFSVSSGATGGWLNLGVTLHHSLKKETVWGENLPLVTPKGF